MPRFAANLGYLFTEQALLGRIEAAAQAGFSAIELQFPYDVPASEVKAAIARNSLTMLGVNTPPGREGEFGGALQILDIDPLGRRALLDRDDPG